MSGSGGARAPTLPDRTQRPGQNGSTRKRSGSSRDFSAFTYICLGVAMLFGGMIVGLVVLPQGSEPVSPIAATRTNGPDTLTSGVALQKMQDLLTSEQQRRVALESQLATAAHDLQAAELDAQVARDVLEKTRRDLHAAEATQGQQPVASGPEDEQQKVYPAPTPCPSPASIPLPPPTGSSQVAIAAQQQQQQQPSGLHPDHLLLANGKKPWLVIGIPSVGRRNGLDYLNPTLDYLLEQLPPKDRTSDPMHGRVLIVVMNNGHGKAHEAFDKAAARLAPGKHPKAPWVRFVTNQTPLLNDGKDPGSPNRPGWTVRQQTMDVVALMEYIGGLSSKGIAPASGRGQAPSLPVPAHYMFMEDDFRLCPHGLIALEYLLRKAYRQHRDWNMIRISYGLVGGVMRGEDVPVLSKYMRSRYKLRPPDHLLVEWYAGETDESAQHKNGRPHFAFRHNLLEHFGTVSSLRNQNQGQFAGCYELMNDRVVFEVESFKPKECPGDDIWPCKDTPFGDAAADAAMEGHPNQYPPREPRIDFSPLEKIIKRVDHTGNK